MSRRCVLLGITLFAGCAAPTLLGCGTKADPFDPGGDASGGDFGTGAAPNDTGGAFPGGGGSFGSGGTLGTGARPSSGGSFGSGGNAPAAGGNQGSGGSDGSGGDAPAAGGNESGGSVGSGGSPGSGGGGSKPPCITKPSQVVILGDSYVTGFAGTPNLQNALASILPGSASYRNYAYAGISLASGGIPLGAPIGVSFIPQEFDPTALTADPDIKLVIMTGGGNDLLLPPAGSPDCKNLANNTTTAGCTSLVQAALDASTTLVKGMSTKGVKDVIYFFYPHLPSVTGGLGGTTSNALLDYSYTKAGPLCESAESTTNGQLRCHFVDMRKAFEDSGSVSGAGPWTNIASDGVHPTAAGQALIAKAVKETMDQRCLGKDASSGCCAP